MNIATFTTEIFNIMSKIDILIVEDESIVAKDLQLSLKKFGYNVIGIAATAEKAIELARAKKPNLILMDIMLKDKSNGVEAAEIIKEELHVPVIYLTANTDKDTVQKAKITEPHGFIVKPFKEIDLQTSIEMALYKFEQEGEILKERDLLYTLMESKDSKDAFFVKNKSRFIKLKAEEIFYVEALKDYVVIHTADTRYTIHTTMKEIDKKLPSSKFIRVHRSYIVQINRIKQIEYAVITLDGVTQEIPVGGSYKSTLQEKLNFF